MRITILFLAAVMWAQAQPPPERVSWNRTPEVLNGKLVLIKLTGGTRIEGGWVSVTPSTFTMRIEKTSNKREVQKGLQTIPRSSISEVRARKRRVRGRVIGTLAGFYGIATIGAVASGSMEALQGPTGLAAVGGAVAGFLIGKSFDHTSHEIILVSENSGAGQ